MKKERENKEVRMISVPKLREWVEWLCTPRFLEAVHKEEM
jgi:hypothetical protein